MRHGNSHLLIAFPSINHNNQTVLHDLQQVQTTHRIDGLPLLLSHPWRSQKTAETTIPPPNQRHDYKHILASLIWSSATNHPPNVGIQPEKHPHPQNQEGKSRQRAEEGKNQQQAGPNCFFGKVSHLVLRNPASDYQTQVIIEIKN